MLSRVLSGHSFLHIVRRAIIPTWAGNTQRAVSTLPTVPAHSAQSIQLLGHSKHMNRIEQNASQTNCALH